MTTKFNRTVKLPNGNCAKMHVTTGDVGGTAHGYVYVGGKRVYGTSEPNGTIGYKLFAPIGKWAQLVQTSVTEEAEKILANV